MSPTPPPMVLNVSFDIEQISETLTWHFTRSDNNANPKKGKAAGSVYFTVGEKFLVEIRGGSEKSFPGFEVLNCCLISVPKIYRCGPETPTEYAPPSLFVSDEGVVKEACIVLPTDQFKVRDVQPPKDNFEIIQDWTGHLTVGSFNGRWKLSMVLTVGIMHDDGRPPSIRVFAFDPEGTVGTGIDPH